MPFIYASELRAHFAKRAPKHRPLGIRALTAEERALFEQPSPGVELPDSEPEREAAIDWLARQSR